MAATTAALLAWFTRKVLGDQPTETKTASARVKVGARAGCVGPPPPEDCKKGTKEQETCPSPPFSVPEAVSRSLPPSSLAVKCCVSGLLQASLSVSR